MIYIRPLKKNAWTTQKKKVKHHQKDISNIKLVTVELTSELVMQWLVGKSTYWTDSHRLSQIPPSSFRRKSQYLDGVTEQTSVEIVNHQSPTVVNDEVWLRLVLPETDKKEIWGKFFKHLHKLKPIKIDHKILRLPLSFLYLLAIWPLLREPR